MLLQKDERVDVAIHFQTKREMYGHKETDVSEIVGEIMEKSGSIYLRFDEIMEDVGVVTTMIKLTEQSAVIIRHGAVTMRQMLVLDKETEGSYQTPYGRLAMRATAKEISSQWNHEAEKGMLRLKYILKMDGQEEAEHELMFTLRRYEEVE